MSLLKQWDNSIYLHMIWFGICARVLANHSKWTCERSVFFFSVCKSFYPIRNFISFLSSISKKLNHNSFKCRPKRGKGKEIHRAGSSIKWHVKPLRANSYTVPSACNKEHGDAMRKGFYLFHFVNHWQHNLLIEFISKYPIQRQNLFF